jgi:chromosome segregation ATPase
VPPRVLLSDEEEREDREDRQRLRAIDSKLRSLFDRREELIAEVRRISSEQKAIYDRRLAPQVEVERLYEEHNALGKRIAEHRHAREAARKKVEEAIVRVREVRLTFAPGERVRPDQIRKEIAQLELRQQTRALPLDEENALIALLRQRAQDLKQAEARTATVAAHQSKLKEAEAALTAAREEFESSGAALQAAKTERDAKMTAVREKLQVAGELIASLREKGRARADAVGKVDGVSREMDELEREARRIVARSRTRREQARRMLRAYSHGPGPPSEEFLATTAEAQLEELLKRGKITLGG